MPKGVVEIDLHGLSVEEAEAKLTDCLDKALLKNAWCINIVHGKGSGKLKNFVSKYLSKSQYIDRFEPDPVNPGVTKAFL